MAELSHLEDVYLEQIKQALVFSEEDLVLIKQVGHFNFFGRTGPVTQESLKRYYTIEGIEQQLSDFQTRIGLVYLLEIKNSQVHMSKRAVELKRTING